MKISAVTAFQIYDSRGNPTLEACVELENGVVGRGLVPSGASTGRFEALELRDGDANYLGGNSVRNAVAHVETELASAVVGQQVFDQAGIDAAMIDLDGTPNKSRLGANALLAVSMAVANAAAAARGVPLYEYLGNGEGTLLPLPEIQIVGGGAHAAWRTDIQDFLIIATGATTFAETLEMTHNVYHAAVLMMKQRGRYSGAADEGGLWPQFDSHTEILDFVVDSIEVAGYRPGEEVAISLDVAASDLFDPTERVYRLRLEGESHTAEAFADLLLSWCDRYPIVSIEDPMADSDWTGWAVFREQAPGTLQIVGDDLFTTNVQRIQQGIDHDVANAVLIKLNQIGTVTETLRAIDLTLQAGWRPIVSARSGETEDTFISHLAVATNAGQLKVGSFSRGERMAKWNEVLRIGRHLRERATFLGGSVLG